MSANSKEIALTVRLPNALYKLFRDKAKAQGATHNGVIEMLVGNWVNDLCWHSASQSHTVNSSPTIRTK